MSDARIRMAQALARYAPDASNPMAQNPGTYDSAGLAHPAIDPIMLLSTAAGPSMARALVGMSRMAPGLMAQEAGALFPEGEIPQITNKALADEFESVAPQSRVNYVRNNNLADWHAQNQDWPRVLADKWAMLKNTAGN